MKIGKLGAICLSGILLIGGTVPAAEYTNYVALTGSDSYGGTSFEDAYRTLTNAVAKAAYAITNDGATYAYIYVGVGTFTGGVELVLSQPIAVIGQPGAQSIIRQTNSAPGSTTPNPLNRVFSLTHANARLDGLVIENGQCREGGNVYMTGGTVTNCIIRNCRGVYKTGGMGYAVQRGGGISMTNGCLVTDCIISNNVVNGGYNGAYSTVVSYGGGVYMTGGTLRKTRVYGNAAYSQGDQAASSVPVYGGGIHIAGASAVVEDCLIWGNRIYQAAAYSNALFAGAGVYLSAGTLRNCTIIDNTNNVTINQNWGAGLRQTGGTAVNCIVWGNVMTNTPSDYSSNSVQNVTYSCAPELTGGAGNKTNDPLFTDPSSANYHLLLSSPCVNAGTNQPDWMATATDFDGHPRILGGTVDMGAYELLPPRGTMIMMQ